MEKWFPLIYDMAMKPLETKVKKIRKTLVSEAAGRVLEIGSGTGVNFQYYKNATQVDAIEPNPLMKERSLKWVEKSHIPIRTYVVKAEKLPFADHTFDSVIATLVFCTISDPIKALQEIQRVSKPDAEIFLFEHVRVDQPCFGKMQDILNPLWKKTCGGCHLNRDTLQLLKRFNLSILSVDSYFKGVFLSIKCLNKKEHQ